MIFGIFYNLHLNTPTNYDIIKAVFQGNYNNYDIQRERIK